jgi:hypothetical protein
LFPYSSAPTLPVITPEGKESQSWELGMKMRFHNLFSLRTLLLLLVACSPAAAQLTYPGAAQTIPQAASSATQSQNAPQASPQNLQAVSQTGLLPVYGVDLRLDPTWIDGSNSPSQSSNFPNSGTSSAFQQVWGVLKPGGYSVLRVTLDVRDSAAAANRAANLCAWAKANNVRLILSLTAEDAGQPISDSFPKQSSDFVKALVGLVRANNGQYLANYSQILAYQLEDELNHPGKHGGMTESAAQQLALAAAKSLRSTEHDSLNGSGTASTPLVASASFDFDLISAGAIAGGTMSDANYSQAYETLKKFLSGLAGSADLDVLVVDWFVGSLGGGGVEKAPALLKSLLTDVTGKQLILGTGFSTAFRSPDEQKRLFTTAFANLGDFRASNGADSPFIGTIFREALNGSTPNPAAPRASLPAEVDKWDWTARAAELTAMWTQKKDSADMTWWLSRVENNMGLITLQSDAGGNVVSASPLPAQQGMTQIATAVGAVSSQMASTPAVSSDANNFAQPGTGIVNSPAGAGASTYASAQQQIQPGGLPPASAANPYGVGASNFGAQPQQSAANPYGAASANSYAQSGCTPSYQGLQPSANPYAQQLYGQQPATPMYGQQPATGMYGQQPAATMYGQLPSTTCSPSGAVPGFGSAQLFQGFAQQTMMGLLNGVLQRLAGVPPGMGGPGFNSGYPNASIPAYPGSQPSVSTTALQPLGSVAPTIQIGPQDVSLQPAAPQVGTSTTISVNLHNLSSVDAPGLVVQAGGSDGATLAQLASVHVGPNSSLPVQLQWFPSSATSSYGITISVGNGSGNQLASAQLGPLTVTAPASGNSGSGTASSGSAGTGTSGTSGGSSSSAGGTTGSCATGGAASTVSGCGSSSTPGGNSGGGTGNSPINTSPLGSVTVTAVQVGIPGQPVVTGQATSVLVPLLNSYLIPLSNLTATLQLDGQILQTQSISTLLPQQSHTVIFQGVTFSSSGQHQISVNVSSQRPASAALTSTATQPVSVIAASNGTTATGGSTATSSTTGSTAGVVVSANSLAAVRSLMPQVFQIGRMVLPSRPGPLPGAGLAATNGSTGSTPAATPSNPAATGQTASAQLPAAGSPAIRSITALPPRPGSTGAPAVSSNGAPVRPGPNGVVTSLTPSSNGAPVRPGPGGALGSFQSSQGGGASLASVVTGLDLSVSVPDVSFNPTAPLPGQLTTFTAVVRNFGTAGTQSASVTFKLIADSGQIASSAPLVFSIPGRGAFHATWTTMIPAGQKMQLVVFVNANGDLNPANNQATVFFSVPAQLPRR